MRARIITFWEQLRTSFWFVPTLMVGAAVALAIATIALDEAIRFVIVQELGWIYTGGPEGARALLSTVASSVITVLARVPLRLLPRLRPSGAWRS